jgi:hypothetical protein
LRCLRISEPAKMREIAVLLQFSGLTWSENACKALKDDPPMPILAK